MPDMNGFISGVLASALVFLLSLPLARAYNKSQNKRDARRRATREKEFRLYEQIASDAHKFIPALIYHSIVLLLLLIIVNLSAMGGFYLSTQPQAEEDPMNALYWFNSLLSLALIFTAMFAFAATLPHFRIFFGLCQAKGVRNLIPLSARNLRSLPSMATRSAGSENSMNKPPTNQEAQTKSTQTNPDERSAP
ncbi:hypothetical protein [Serinicoccus hydrothermalis]|uniref:hypothetical protein n=1 Tax=Serinicoccus hydrothermalis TaxID=1758689 RepID=UPI0012FA4248|nr:hypothetical protein [Serinicoccus hydrothermalis]